VFLGHSVAQQKNMSEETAQKIDSEIRRLIDQAYDEPWNGGADCRRKEGRSRQEGR
jgi:hypothetical protein